MAVFNPQVNPTNDPNWTNVSRPISDLTADKSKGMTLATIGDTIEGVAKFADTTMKGYLKDTVETGVNSLRDNYTADLQRVRNLQIAGVTPSTQALNSAGLSNDTLAPDPEEIPGGLQAGIDKAKALGTAMVQNGGAGKANDTLYTGALNALAKNLRNQYSGYRDYIDDQIKSVSGIDPANAFYKNLLEDINRGAQNTNKDKDRDLAFIDKYVDNTPGAAAMRGKYLNGEMNGQQLREFVADQHALKINQAAAEASRAAAKSAGELTVQRSKSDFSQEVGEVFNNAWNIQRISANVATPKQLSDYFTGQATGQTPIMSEEQNRMWLTSLAAQRDDAARQARAIALRRDSEGNSYAKNVGGLANLKAETDEQLRLYDDVITFAKNKDYSMVYHVLNQNNAIVNKAKNELYKDPTVGEQTVRTQAVSEAVGPQVGSIMLADAILGGMDKKYTAYVGGAKESMLGQPDPNNPTTLNGVIDDARSKKIADPGVYKSLTEVAKVIARPDVYDKGKVNAAIALFHPDNIGVLRKFAKDQPDPQDPSRIIPGREAAFQIMTDPTVTDGIAKLPIPQQRMYRDWVEKEWGGIIARDQIKDLSQIKDRQFLKSHSIFWDSDTAQFEVRDARGRPLDAVGANNAIPVTQTVDKINEGLRNIAHVEKSAGGDINAYVVKVLSNSGFDFKNNVDGIPKKMMDALLSAWQGKPVDSAIKPPISR